MGVDNISAKLLKKAGVAIVDPITHIINLSLQTSIIPDSWKRARLYPIYKSGDHTDPSNYRPIAILPVLSKICEKVVFAQVYELTINFIVVSQALDLYIAQQQHC